MSASEAGSGAGECAQEWSGREGCEWDSKEYPARWGDMCISKGGIIIDIRWMGFKELLENTKCHVAAKIVVTHFLTKPFKVM